jgi:DNA primase
MKPLSSERRNLLERACQTFEAHREEVLGYLEGRGISLRAAEDYRLGCVPQTATEGFEQYAGMLAIPYLTPAGPVHFKFRRLDDGKPKYIGLSGGNYLYNVKALSDATDTIAICEGELDALVLSASGIPSVGIPGASNWQKHWRYIFADFSRVIAFVDGDDAGRNMAKSLQEKIDARPVILPDGMDVSDVLMEDWGLDWIKGKI